MIRLRASQMSLFMSNSRDKSGLGQTAKKAALRAYADSKYGMREDISSPYLEKGNAREQDAIVAYSTHLKVFMRKNDIRLSDDYCTGEPDLFIPRADGSSITDSQIIPDIKNAWSYMTFLDAKCNELSDDRYWQGQTYMRLTGAQEAHFVVCWMNATYDLLMSEINKQWYKMGQPSMASALWVKKQAQIERNMIADMDEFLKENAGYVPASDVDRFINIPMKERICIKPISRNEEDIKKIETRAVEVNEWLAKQGLQ